MLVIPSEDVNTRGLLQRGLEGVTSYGITSCSMTATTVSYATQATIYSGDQHPPSKLILNSFYTCIHLENTLPKRRPAPSPHIYISDQIAPVWGQNTINQARRSGTNTHPPP